jgi:hypothetical protein
MRSCTHVTTKSRVPPSVCHVEQRPRLITPNVGVMPVSHQANLARVKVIMRELDEMCMAAAKLRRRIQRDMRATRAREEIGFRDDQAVTRARDRKKA